MAITYKHEGKAQPKLQPQGESKTPPWEEEKTKAGVDAVWENQPEANIKAGDTVTINGEDYMVKDNAIYFSGAPFLPDEPVVQEYMDSLSVGQTTVVHKDGSIEEKNIMVEAPEEAKKPIAKQYKCTVGVNANRTVNLGNYESVKIGVMLTMPCDAEDLDTMYAFTKEWVDTKMGELVEGVSPEPTN